MVKKFSFRKFALSYNVFIIFALLFILCAFSSSSFLLPINLRNIGLQQCYPVFVAVGMLFPIIIGTIDLSVGSVMGFTASVEALTSGKIDAFFCVAGAPTPSIIRLSESRDVLFLEIDDEHLSQLIQYDPYYTRHVIPAGTYKGQDTGIRTLGLKATLIASWKLPDDVVYEITRNLFENRAEIAQAHAAGTELSIDFADDHRGVTIPFHPGAGRYYKEIGHTPVLPLPLLRSEQ